MLALVLEHAATVLEYCTIAVAMVAMSSLAAGVVASQAPLSTPYAHVHAAVDSVLVLVLVFVVVVVALAVAVASYAVQTAIAAAVVASSYYLTATCQHHHFHVHFHFHCSYLSLTPLH